MSTNRLSRLLAAALLTFSFAACSDTPVDPGSEGSRRTAWKRWSDRSTWPEGKVPTAGAMVVIPKGHPVLLDVSPPPLAGLRIHGSLRFDQQDLDLTAASIMVHGTLQIGTEAEPFRHRATITLTGADDGQDMMGMGGKVLGVMPGGVLDLHGMPRLSWTRLAATAVAGASDLTLETEANWQPGDRVVVASSDFDPGEAEEAVVQTIDGRRVTLSTPLKYPHWGTLQTIAGRTVDERAEVGLLTRNITIRGDDASTNGFGGHLMVMGGAVARIEGVEFYRMGQKAKVARYPVHWHMAGAVPGQYARNNSIWKSFNRCLTIHGTHELRVERNVCYDHLGHGYFLEDGIETRNTLQGNLGLVTRVPARGEMVLPSDDRAATFWITNPDNTIRDNVAAGSEGFGYWFALPEHPTGMSATSSVWPRRTPLLEFSGNVAHSNRGAGLQVDDGPRPDGTTEGNYYRPRRNPAAESPAVIADFKGLVAYKHGHAAWLRGDNLRMSVAVLADNAVGVTFAAHDSYLQESVVIGETENASPFPPGFPIHGFQFYDGRVWADRVLFANFNSTDGRPAAALGFRRANGFVLDPTNFVSEVTFVNSNRVYIYAAHPGKDADKNATALDLDGSLTGTAGHSVVANSPHLVTSACSYRSEWNAQLCPNRYVNLMIWSDVQRVAPLDVRRDDGATVALAGIEGNLNAASMSALADRQHTLSFRGAAPLQLRLSVGRMKPGESVRLVVPYAGRGLRVYRPRERSRVLEPVRSEAEVDASAGDRYFLDAARGLLHLKIVPDGGSDSGAVFVDPL